MRLEKAISTSPKRASSKNLTAIWHLELARSVAIDLGVVGWRSTSRSKSCFDASPDSPGVGLVSYEETFFSRTRRRRTAKQMAPRETVRSWIASLLSGAKSQQFHWRRTY